ncbi:MAG: hypothetical protein ACI9MR_001748 [Myxococcota bacterium]|jgi:hypothetical protein
MSIFDSLSGLLNADTVGAIAGSLGSEQGKTQSAVSAALPALIAALASNTSKKSGRKSLNKALKTDHDGGILNDIGGFLTSSGGQAAGAAILGHIFGGKQPAVQQQVAEKSGMDSADVAKMLATLAPVVMGFLGKKKRDEQLTGKQIASQLADDRRSIEQRPEVDTGWLGMLDSDGDGSPLNDLAGLAGGLLSGLSKK